VPLRAPKEHEAGGYMRTAHAGQTRVSVPALRTARAQMAAAGSLTVPAVAEVANALWQRTTHAAALAGQTAGIPQIATRYWCCCSRRRERKRPDSLCARCRYGCLAPAMLMIPTDRPTDFCAADDDTAGAATVAPPLLLRREFDAARPTLERLYKHATGAAAMSAPSERTCCESWHACMRGDTRWSGGCPSSK